MKKEADLFIGIDPAKDGHDKTEYHVKVIKGRDLNKAMNTVLGFERTIIVGENAKPRLNMFKLYRDKSGKLQFREVGSNAN